MAVLNHDYTLLTTGKLFRPDPAPLHHYCRVIAGHNLFQISMAICLHPGQGYKKRAGLDLPRINRHPGDPNARGLVLSQNSIGHGIEEHRQQKPLAVTLLSTLFFRSLTIHGE